MPLPGTPTSPQNELWSVGEFVRTPNNEYEYVAEGKVAYRTDTVAVVYNPTESALCYHGPHQQAGMWKRREVGKYERASLPKPHLAICSRSDWDVEDLNRIVAGGDVAGIIRRIQKIEDPHFPGPLTVAIVGTAGRQDDGPKLTAQVYALMFSDCLQRLQRIAVPARLRLVSGGAAWADHLAVSLYLGGHAALLDLYLPTPFLGPFNGYQDSGYRCPGRAANKYHREFSHKMGRSSFKSIEKAKLKGAKCEVIPGGFFGRNTKVASEADILIAYTFGDRHDIPKDGGTLDTWKKATIAQRIHVPIASLGLNGG